MKRKKTGRRSLSILALLFGLAGCTKEESLVLLDLRPSGPLGAPVARIRLSAKGWPKRTVDGPLDVAGLRIGYYGAGDGSAVTVTAEALDAVDCVLGSGSATVPGLKAGAISAPTTLFVRPQPANGCVPDAGTDAGTDAGEDTGSGDDAGSDVPVDAGMDAVDDASTDAAVDAEVDAGVEAAVEAGFETGIETGVDAGTDATADDGAPDAGAPDASAPDADDDATAADATAD